MQRKILCIAAAVLWTLSLSALAAQGAVDSHEVRPGGEAQGTYGASNPPSFEVADANGDDRISPQELIAFGIPFPDLDRNRDGSITRDEYLTGTALYGAHDSQVELFPQEARRER